MTRVDRGGGKGADTGERRGSEIVEICWRGEREKRKRELSSSPLLSDRRRKLEQMKSFPLDMGREKRLGIRQNGLGRQRKRYVRLPNR